MMITQSENAEIAADFKSMSEHFVGYSQTDPYIGGFGVFLNYSPASIAALDEFLRELYGTEGAAPGDQPYELPESKTPTVMEIGAYLGETVRRCVGGVWVNDPAKPKNLWEMRISFGDEDEFIKPFLCMLLRFKNGCSDDLFPGVYQVMISKRPERIPEMAESFLQQATAFEERSALPPERKAQLARMFRKLAADIASGALSQEAPPPSATEKLASISPSEDSSAVQTGALFELESSIATAKTQVEGLQFLPGELHGHSAEEQDAKAAAEKKQASIQRALIRSQERIVEQQERRRKTRLRFLAAVAVVVLLPILIFRPSFQTIRALAFMVILMFGVGFLRR